MQNIKPVSPSHKDALERYRIAAPGARTSARKRVQKTLTEALRHAVRLNQNEASKQVINGEA